MTPEPGDILLYSSRSLIGFFIRLKTWSRFSHVELFLGNGKVATSRDEGVQWFDYTEENLEVILRPNATRPFNLTEATEFYQSCIGQKYDWWGLFRFFKLGKQSDTKQHCAEICTRVSRKIWYLDSGVWVYFHPFADKYDADLVSPGMFFASPHYDVVWDKRIK